jgi:hypothetical protein
MLATNRQVQRLATIFFRTDTILRSQMSKDPWWSVRWWRVILALLIVFASIFLIELWTRPFLAARYLGANEAVGLPTPQPDSTVAKEPVTRMKRRGVSFEVPWIETDKSKRASISGSGLILFTNRLMIMVQPHQKSLDFIRAMKGIRAIALRHELGSEVLSSEFALTSASLTTRASDAKWWHTPIYNEKVALLLAVKTGITGLLDSPHIPIYTLSVGGIRGFQVGDLKGKQDEVKLILFDQTDRACGIALVNFQNVTQAEIDALVGSLRFEE